MDLQRTQARLKGEPLRLTPTEWGLLEAFVTNPGKLLTHQWMLRRVWGPGYTLDQSHYLRIYVRQLRRKLADSRATEAAPEREAELVASIGTGVFQGGFDALKRQFGGESR